MMFLFCFFFRVVFLSGQCVGPLLRYVRSLHNLRGVRFRSCITATVIRTRICSGHGLCSRIVIRGGVAEHLARSFDRGMHSGYCRGVICSIINSPQSSGPGNGTASRTRIWSTLPFTIYIHSMYGFWTLNGNLPCKDT